MNCLHVLQQLCRLLVLTERSEDKDEVLDCVWVTLILRLDVREELLTIRVLAQLHQAKRLDRHEERLLLILQQTRVAKLERLVEVLLRQQVLQLCGHEDVLTAVLPLLLHLFRNCRLNHDALSAGFSISN